MRGNFEGAFNCDRSAESRGGGVDEVSTIPVLLYADPESHNAQSYRQTDGQTDGMMMPIADHTVRSAKNRKTINLFLMSGRRNV